MKIGPSSSTLSKSCCIGMESSVWPMSVKMFALIFRWSKHFLSIAYDFMWQIANSGFVKPKKCSISACVACAIIGTAVQPEQNAPNNSALISRMSLMKINSFLPLPQPNRCRFFATRSVCSRSLSNVTVAPVFAQIYFKAIKIQGKKNAIACQYFASIKP